MDIIFLRDFRLKTLIGVYEWEHQVPQTIQFDLEIGLPAGYHAPQSDNVQDTIDYAKVVETIKASLAERHFQLVEALAEHIAQLVMTRFGSPWIRVTVTKLGLIAEVKQLGVMIERGKREVLSN